MFMTNAKAFDDMPTAASFDTLPRSTLFGLPIVNATLDQATDDLLRGGKRLRVSFVNAHCINQMQHNTDYRAALLTADRVLPDGIGVELAARMNGQSLAANLNGTDLVPHLLRKARTMGLSVFLFGGRPGVAEDAAERLLRDMHGLRIVGTRDGFGGAADADEAIAAINASGADIVLVALGVPMQDVWLARNAHRLNARLTLGVGALLDFLANRVSRAPALVRRAKMEWVWRLAMEPRRMARRYLIGNAVFMLRETRHALRTHATTQSGTAAKRLLDLAVSGGALVLLAPLFVLVALMLKAESSGPIFFRQTRIGKDGQPFTIFKFRSMYQSSGQPSAALRAQSDRQGICFKSRNDPRVTRVGRVLRRYSIDELPQILNVLLGDMSIVGPRPALPEEVAAYPANALGRLAVKPGLTGIWQVSGRAEINFDRMVAMDLAYARSHSILLDLLLIAMTFRAVISGRGAY